MECCIKKNCSIVFHINTEELVGSFLVHIDHKTVKSRKSLKAQYTFPQIQVGHYVVSLRKKSDIPKDRGKYCSLVNNLI
jgi:hypothetical protein